MSQYTDLLQLYTDAEASPMDKETFARRMDQIIKYEGYPIGSFYVQFPDANSNTASVAFPDSKAPATMYSGTTWTVQWNTEAIFFRTEGESNTRTTGKQEDATAVNNLVTANESAHTHSYTSPASSYTVNAGTAKAIPLSGANTTGAGSAHNHPITSIDAETRPVNRLMRIWKRTS